MASEGSPGSFRVRQARSVARSSATRGVEGDALGQDLAHGFVAALDLLLLVGVHRVAEEDVRAARAVQRVFVACRVGKPGAALGDERGEEICEAFAGEGGCRAPEISAHLLDELAHANPRLERRRGLGRCVLLSFGHCFFRDAGNVPLLLGKVNAPTP